MINQPLKISAPAFKANNPGAYKPDALSSGGAKETPFQSGESSTVPKTGSIVPTLLKLAMRRIPGFGFGAVHGHGPSVVKNAVTAGSHGQLK